MPQFLSEVKIIDLNRSTVDEGKSGELVGKHGRKESNFEFKKRVYASKKYSDSTTRPRIANTPVYFAWNRNHPREIQKWKSMCKFEIVTVNDPFVPEGVAPNAEGRYIFNDDMILMQCPLVEWVLKRKREIAKSDRAARARIQEFEDSVRAQGLKVAKREIEDYT